MKLSKQQVEHIAQLARLELKEEEKEKFQEQLSSILGYVDKLQKADTKGVQPAAHITGQKNVMRNDVSKQTDEETRKLLLENMPAREDDLLKTKGVFR